MIIKGEQVDSFQLRSPGTHQKCWYKGCQRAGRVVLFYTVEKGRQERAWICVNHALDLANNVLTVFKFGREDG